MKKATVKSAKTSEATPKTPKKTVKKAAAVAPAAPRAKKSAAPKAPAVKAAPAKVASTVIVAAIDVGFGNALYVRGEGPGLSWDIGLPMVCVADDKWSVELPVAARPVVFKFLLNDTTWCVGSDYVVGPGEHVTLTPEF